MTENEQMGSASTESSAEDRGIAKSITQSFMNRVNRLKSDLDEDVDMSSPTPVTSPIDRSTQPEAKPEPSPTPEPTPSPVTTEDKPQTPITAPKTTETATTPDELAANLGLDRMPQMAPSTSSISSPAKIEVEKIPPKKPAKTPAKSSRQSRQARRARLRISRVDPWSVMKTALLFGVAGWIIMIVMTYIIFTVLDTTGLYDAVNSTVATIFASPDQTEAFKIENYINTTRATALAALVGAVNVVIITALATIFAFLYNLTAVVMGGIEVTMAED